METLGEDLVLLALRPNGTMHAQQRLRFALSGAELLRLTALGKVEIVGGRLSAPDRRSVGGAQTGDSLLDLAFADLCRRGLGRPARTWIAGARPGLVERYLRRLAAHGVVRLEQHRALGLFRTNRWRVLEPGRVQEIRARLDRIAASNGELTAEQAAFAGLVHVAGLDVALYPAGSGARERARLRQIARRRPARTAPQATVDPAYWAVNEVILASLDACAPGSVLSDSEHHSAHPHGGHDGTRHGDQHSHHPIDGHPHVDGHPHGHSGGFDAGGFSGGHHH